jgi:CheY-like chemotaxis protein
MRTFEHSSSTSSSSSTAPATGRVLVIDDHPQVRAMLCVAFETAGLQVQAADSPGSAAAWLRSAWPQVVLIDLQRAETHGLEAVRSIRDRPALDGLAVVFLAGDLSAGLRWRALQAGADLVVQKPLSLLELQERVSRLACAGRPRLRLVGGRTPERRRLAG